MGNRRKVLVVGLDAAEPAVIRSLTEAGELPAFRALGERALHGSLANTPGFGNFSQWASAVTGVNPGRHGRYNIPQLRAGSYQFERVPDDDQDFPCFWERLDGSDARIAVVDPAHAPLPDRLNGIFVTNWAVHDATPPGLRTVPASLADDIHADFDAVALPGGGRLPPDASAAAEEALATALLERIDSKTAVLEQLFDSDTWDMFFTCYMELHYLGHAFWHLHDTRHPAHDPARAARLGNPLLEGYRRVDSGLASLIARAGPDTVVVVLALAGMGPANTLNHLLGDILLRLDRATGGSGERSPVQRLRRGYRALVPNRLRESLRRRFPGATAPFSDQVRRRERWFGLTHPETAGAIRINLAGREPAGTVQPGAGYDACCATLESCFRDLVDPASGRPLVTEVVRVDAVCHGPARHRLPDLLVVWNQEVALSGAASPLIGEVPPGTPRPGSGDHTLNNLIMAAGPGIRPGELPGPVALEDVAPTLAALLGVDLADIDGRPIPAIAGPARPGR